MGNFKEKTYLGRFLAICGVASRRQAVELVKSGRVQVNGVVELNPACLVNASDRIVCENTLVEPPREQHYIMLYKPVGYVCTHDDPHAAKKAVDLIELKGVKLAAAGRLDRESEGMLIFSTDGKFLHEIAHPSFCVLKAYCVVTDRPLPDAHLTQMRQGILDQGEMLQVREVRTLAENCYGFVLNEGRKRELRRLVAAGGGRVRRLVRLSTGLLGVRGLKPGQWRELTPQEREFVRRKEVVPEEIWKKCASEFA